MNLSNDKHITNSYPAGKEIGPLLSLAFISCVRFLFLCGGIVRTITSIHFVAVRLAVVITI